MDGLVDLSEENDAMDVATGASFSICGWTRNAGTSVALHLAAAFRREGSTELAFAIERDKSWSYRGTWRQGVPISRRPSVA